MHYSCALIGLFVSLSLASAEASSLMGDSISCSEPYPNASCVGSGIIGPGIEYELVQNNSFSSPLFSFDFDESSLIITALAHGNLVTISSLITSWTRFEWWSDVFIAGARGRSQSNSHAERSFSSIQRRDLCCGTGSGAVARIEIQAVPEPGTRVQCARVAILSAFA